MNELILSLIMITLLVAFFVAVSEIVSKAGYSRWWALILFGPLFNVLGVIFLAMSEWPIYRELGWLRVLSGKFTEEDYVRAQTYALNLEQRGDTKEALLVYEELSRKAPDAEQSDYAARNAAVLLERLKDKAAF